MDKKHVIPFDPADRAFIEAHDLSLGDLRMKAYQHVNLTLARGGAHAICAEDKGGTTELLLTLAGRMHPSSGSCSVAGNDISRLRGMHAVRKIASLAFIENVNEVERVLRVRTIASAELGLAGKRSNAAATREFLDQWELGAYFDSTIEELPRYVYDRLGIALAMAHDPQILCVGDIEGNLTEKESLELCELLIKLHTHLHTLHVALVGLCGVHVHDFHNASQHLFLVDVFEPLGHELEGGLQVIAHELS